MSNFESPNWVNSGNTSADVVSEVNLGPSVSTPTGNGGYVNYSHAFRYIVLRCIYVSYRRL